AVVDLKEAEPSLGVAARPHPALQLDLLADGLRLAGPGHADLFHCLPPEKAWLLPVDCIPGAGSSDTSLKRQRRDVPDIPALALGACVPSPGANTSPEHQRRDRGPLYAVPLPP